MATQHFKQLKFTEGKKIWFDFFIKCWFQNTCCQLNKERKKSNAHFVPKSSSNSFCSALFETPLFVLLYRHQKYTTHEQRKCQGVQMKSQTAGV